MRVGVVGSGMISRIYLENMTRRFEILEVGGVCSAHFENAKRRADEFGLPAMTLEDMLADGSIDMIVNLTPTPAHEGIIRQALEAGKHVYTEKTMTTGHESARALADLAASKGLWLGSAPDTFLGAALQTARRAIDDGLIGEVTSFAFAANRDNSFLTQLLPLPEPALRRRGLRLCRVLPHRAVQPAGPVARVAAAVRAPYPTRVDIDPKSKTYGQRIDTPNESEISAVLTLKSGVSGTAHVNADSVIEDQHFFAIYGTKGILYLPDPNGFGGEVRLQPNWAYDAAPAPARALGNRPLATRTTAGASAPPSWPGPSARAGPPAPAPTWPATCWRSSTPSSKAAAGTPSSTSTPVSPAPARWPCRRRGRRAASGIRN